MLRVCLLYPSTPQPTLLIFRETQIELFSRYLHVGKQAKNSGGVMYCKQISILSGQISEP